MQKEAAAYYFNKLQAFSDADHRAFDRPYIDHATVKRVHIVGVCGTAMGSLAGLFVEKGFMISGSDTACYPPMSDMIESLGITFYEGYREENCKDADVIVMGNAIGPANPEAAYARNNNIPTLSLPEALHIFFTSHRTCLVVAGTHGKTTTTGLLIHILRTAGYDPGFMVGGVLIEDEKSFSVGKDPFFILEGDEYDTAYFDKSPKFLHYHPDSAIVTSVEFDHVDIYKDAQEYDQAFSFLSKEVRENLIVCGDDQHVPDCVQNTTATLMSYGLTAGKDISCTNIQKEREGTAFTLIFKGQEYEDMFVSLVGEHNLLNTLAVCGLALSEGDGIERLHEGLKSFK